MSIQETRWKIINENIPKLIKSLTKFEESDENFELCVRFAQSTLKHHRFLSVNSHEIKRRLEGLQERLIVLNCDEHAEKFAKLCTALITDPICEDHYVTDIHWTILNFLLDLSNDPVKTIKENIMKSKYDVVVSDTEATTNDEEHDKLIELLKLDNIPKQTVTDNSSESELSNWSDTDLLSSDDELINEMYKLKLNSTKVNNIVKQESSSLAISSGKQTPVLPFSIFDSSNSLQWLNDNVQNSWWSKGDYIVNANSTHRSANFCQYWITHLSNLSGGLTQPKQFSIVTEYVLLREIIWMFIEPKNCKFFHIEQNYKITINTNVSLPSTTMDGNQIFLSNYAHYMTIMYRLKEFCSVINNSANIPSTASPSSSSPSPPHSYECYTQGLIQCIQPFINYLLSIEDDLMHNTSGQMSTIIKLYNLLKPYFSILDDLYDIHNFSILDYTANSPHICSAHLIAGLITKGKEASTTQYANLASALILVTIKIYLQIIDIWWTEGRLDDWRNEFLIEKIYDTSQDIATGFEARLITKSKEKSIYISPIISKVIENDKFTILLRDHSLKACYALNILYMLDRISEMKTQCCYQENLYKTFLETVLNDLSKFQGASDGSAAMLIDTNNCHINDNNLIERDIDNLVNLKEFENDLKNMNDDLLAMAFEDDIKYMKNTIESNQVLVGKTVDSIGTNCDNDNNTTNNNDSVELNAFDIFEKLQKISSGILPFEQIIKRILVQLLESRIWVANQFVLRMYKDEYQILQHLKNIRQVFLFEASDLMYSFYSNLFQQIETSNTWANPYLLTLQLDGTICSKYPDVSSLFRIQITSNNCNESKHVLDAVKYIKINYIMNYSLCNIISEQCLDQYNQVFRFLLKVKWGIWTLENLRFPMSWKKRSPFTEMSLNDFIMKRLAMVRIWILYSIQCIHSHLMIEVIQSMGQQIDHKIETADNLLDIYMVHKSYIETIYDLCFQNPIDEDISVGIEQLLSLICVIRDEWYSLCSFRELEHIDVDLDSSRFNASLSLIDEIENTYIHIHSYLAVTLNSEVFSKGRKYLSPLSTAFNCSCPY